MVDQERSFDNENEESVKEEDEGIKPHKVIDMKDAEEGEDQDEDQDNDDEKSEERFYGRVDEDSIRNEFKKFHDETEEAFEGEERMDEGNAPEEKIEEQKEDESESKENKEVSLRIEDDENDMDEFADEIDDGDEDIMKEMSKC